MKMMVLFVTLFVALSQHAFAVKRYKIEFKGYLVTDLEDVGHAMRRQINHSIGPLTNLKAYGYRSSLSRDYTFKVLATTILERNLKRVDYLWEGVLITEDEVDMNTYKVTVPIQAEETIREAQKIGSCVTREYRKIPSMFYQGWSPYFDGCRLVRGETYEEFSLSSFSSQDVNIEIVPHDFLQDGSFNAFYYFGSDFYSLINTGYAGVAYNNFARKLRGLGFYSNIDSDEVADIFAKSQRKLLSKFQKLSKNVNGTILNVYLVLGNPTEVTPMAMREYFDFMKYALKHASYLHYAGHSGLGSVLDLDYLEEIYETKIEHNKETKQFFYFDGCTTFFEAPFYYSSKKDMPNNLIVMSNGLNVQTSLVEAPLFGTFDLFYQGLLEGKSFQGKAFIEEVDNRIDRLIGNKSYLSPMVTMSVY